MFDIKNNWALSWLNSWLNSTNNTDNLDSSNIQTGGVGSLWTTPSDVTQTWWFSSTSQPKVLTSFDMRAIQRKAQQQRQQNAFSKTWIDQNVWTWSTDSFNNQSINSKWLESKISSYMPNLPKTNVWNWIKSSQWIQSVNQSNISKFNTPEVDKWIQQNIDDYKSSKFWKDNEKKQNVEYSKIKDKKRSDILDTINKLQKGIEKDKKSWNTLLNAFIAPTTSSTTNINKPIDQQEKYKKQIEKRNQILKLQQSLEDLNSEWWWMFFDDKTNILKSVWTTFNFNDKDKKALDKLSENDYTDNAVSDILLYKLENKQVDKTDIYKIMNDKDHNAFNNLIKGGTSENEALADIVLYKINKWYDDYRNVNKIKTDVETLSKTVPTYSDIWYKMFYESLSETLQNEIIENPFSINTDKEKTIGSIMNKKMEDYYSKTWAENKVIQEEESQKQMLLNATKEAAENTKDIENFLYGKDSTKYNYDWLNQLKEDIKSKWYDDQMTNILYYQQLNQEKNKNMWFLDKKNDWTYKWFTEDEIDNGENSEYAWVRFAKTVVNWVLFVPNVLIQAKNLVTHPVDTSKMILKLWKWLVENIYSQWTNALNGDYVSDRKFISDDERAFKKWIVDNYLMEKWWTRENQLKYLKEDPIWYLSDIMWMASFWYWAVWKAQDILWITKTLKAEQIAELTTKIASFEKNAAELRKLWLVSDAKQVEWFAEFYNKLAKWLTDWSLKYKNDFTKGAEMFAKYDPYVLVPWKATEYWLKATVGLVKLPFKILDNVLKWYWWKILWWAENANFIMNKINWMKDYESWKIVYENIKSTLNDAVRKYEENLKARSNSNYENIKSNWKIAKPIEWSDMFAWFSSALKQHWYKFNSKTWEVVNIATWLTDDIAKKLQDMWKDVKWFYDETLKPWNLNSETLLNFKNKINSYEWWKGEDLLWSIYWQVQINIIDRIIKVQEKSIKEADDAYALMKQDVDELKYVVEWKETELVTWADWTKTKEQIIKENIFSLYQSWAKKDRVKKVLDKVIEHNISEYEKQLADPNLTKQQRNEVIAKIEELKKVPEDFYNKKIYDSIISNVNKNIPWWYTSWILTVEALKEVMQAVIKKWWWHLPLAVWMYLLSNPWFMKWVLVKYWYLKNKLWSVFSKTINNNDLINKIQTWVELSANEKKYIEEVYWKYFDDASKNNKDPIIWKDWVEIKPADNKSFQDAILEKYMWKEKEWSNQSKFTEQTDKYKFSIEEEQRLADEAKLAEEESAMFSQDLDKNAIGDVNYTNQPWNTIQQPITINNTKNNIPWNNKTNIATNKGNNKFDIDLDQGANSKMSNQISNELQVEKVKMDKEQAILAQQEKDMFNIDLEKDNFKGNNERINNESKIESQKINEAKLAQQEKDMFNQDLDKNATNDINYTKSVDNNTETIKNKSNIPWNKKLKTNSEFDIDLDKKSNEKMSAQVDKEMKIIYDDIKAKKQEMNKIKAEEEAKLSQEEKDMFDIDLDKESSKEMVTKIDNEIKLVQDQIDQKNYKKTWLYNETKESLKFKNDKLLNDFNKNNVNNFLPNKKEGILVWKGELKTWNKQNPTSISINLLENRKRLLEQKKLEYEEFIKSWLYNWSWKGTIERTQWIWSWFENKGNTQIMKYKNPPRSQNFVEIKNKNDNINQKYDRKWNLKTNNIPWANRWQKWTVIWTWNSKAEFVKEWKLETVNNYIPEVKKENNYLPIIKQETKKSNIPWNNKNTKKPEVKIETKPVEKVIKQSEPTNTTIKKSEWNAFDRVKFDLKPEIKTKKVPWTKVEPFKITPTPKKVEIYDKQNILVERIWDKYELSTRTWKKMYTKDELKKEIQSRNIVDEDLNKELWISNNKSVSEKVKENKIIKVNNKKPEVKVETKKEITKQIEKPKTLKEKILSKKKETKNDWYDSDWYKYSHTTWNKDVYEDKYWSVELRPSKKAVSFWNVNLKF